VARMQVRALVGLLCMYGLDNVPRVRARGRHPLLTFLSVIVRKGLGGQGDPEI
jgi:hypothetical protein